MKKALSLALALVMCLGLTVPAMALPAGKATVRADSLEAYGDGIITVVSNGRYGFYKPDGKQVLAPTYSYARGFSDGMAAVSSTGTMGIIDEDFGMEGFSGGKYGYVNESGKLVIPEKYEKAFDFYEGRAFVRETADGPLQMIDKTGKVIASYNDVDLWYYETVHFSEGLAIIPFLNQETYESWYIAVDRNGKTVYTFDDAYVDFEHGYQDGLVAVAAEGSWGTGGPCLERGFNDMVGAGYRDKTGKKVISTDYDSIHQFVDGIAAVGKVVDDPNYYVLNYGFIDTTGKVVIPIKYSDFVLDDGDIRAVTNDQELRAFVTKGGKEITQFLYDATWGFSEELALARKDGVISVIDTSGKTVFTSKDCDRGYSYQNGLSIMWNSTAGKRGAYDKAGNLVVPFQYDGAHICDGYLWLQSGGTWTVYDVAELTAAEPQPEPKPEPQPEPEPEPERGIAKAGDQNIDIDNSPVAFQTYMLLDANGNGTNYVKLRDIAHVLNGTAAQFSVGYNPAERSISVNTGEAYVDGGTEMDTPFAGADKEYTRSNLTIIINGTAVKLDAITLLDSAGNGYNYFKLRDLGQALGFQVDYSRERGVFIETTGA